LVRFHSHTDECLLCPLQTPQLTKSAMSEAV
jgi:hypothetical protein